MRCIYWTNVYLQVIAEVRAQDGDGDQCGMMTCSSSQCCVNSLFCMNIPGESKLTNFVIVLVGFANYCWFIGWLAADWWIDWLLIYFSNC